MSLRIFKVSKVALNRRWITPWLTGAEVRSVEGTNTDHKNAEGIASVGDRVRPHPRRSQVQNHPSLRSSYLLPRQFWFLRQVCWQS